jgi:hypothetical protein
MFDYRTDQVFYLQEPGFADIAKMIYEVQIKAPSMTELQAQAEATIPRVKPDFGLSLPKDGQTVKATWLGYVPSVVSRQAIKLKTVRGQARLLSAGVFIGRAGQTWRQTIIGSSLLASLQPIQYGWTSTLYASSLSG